MKKVTFWDESPEEALTSNGWEYGQGSEATKPKDSDSDTTSPYEFGRWNGRYSVSQLNLSGEK